MRKYICFVCFSRGQQMQPQRSTPAKPYNICLICGRALCSAHSATLCQNGHEHEPETRDAQRPSAGDREDEISVLDVDASARSREQAGGFEVVPEGTIAWNMKPLDLVPLWSAKLVVGENRSGTQYVVNVQSGSSAGRERPSQISLSVKWSKGVEIWRSCLPDMGDVRHSER